MSAIFDTFTAVMRAIEGIVWATRARNDISRSQLFAIGDALIKAGNEIQREALRRDSSNRRA